jgi:hypothetical protein
VASLNASKVNSAGITTDARPAHQIVMKREGLERRPPRPGAMRSLMILPARSAGYESVARLSEA